MSEPADAPALPRVWVDADAVPRAVKEILFRASSRGRLRLTMVANAVLSCPPEVEMITVDGGLDAADEHIAEQVGPGELVITADVPLAALIVEAGAKALDPRGELLDERNIGERVAVRDMMTELRDIGVETGGPRSYQDTDKQRFANALDRWLTRATRR